MALSKNSGYYTEWTSDRGVDYVLVFVPGDTTYLTNPDVSNPANRIEIPRNVLVEKPKGESGFDNEIPQGMVLSDELEFTIDLTALTDISTDDWTSLRSWILNEQSTSPVTIGIDSIYIPNRWILYENTGSSYIVRFEGCQTITPEIEIEINESRELYKVKCLGIERAVLQSLSTGNIAPGAIHTDEDVIWELGYNPMAVPTFTFGVRTDVTLEQKMDITSFNNIKISLATFPNAAIKRFKRNSSATFSIVGSLYGAWTFYQQTLTEDSTKGIVIANNELIDVVTEIRIDGDVIDSLFEDTENSLYKEYPTLWDLLKYWTDDMIMKSLFIRTNNDLYWVLQKIEERLDSAGATIARATLDGSDIVGRKHKIIKKSSIIGEGVSHVPNVPDNSKYYSLEYQDINELKYLNSSILNDNRYEIEMLFHNQPISGSAGYRTEGKFSVALTGAPSIRGMYERDFTFNSVLYERKISDYCEFTDGTDIYTPESGYDTEDLPNGSDAFYIYPAYYFDWLDQRLVQSGKGYVTAKAVAGLYNNIKQFSLETRSLLNIDDIGKLYTLDVDGFTDSGMVASGAIGTDCQLVSISKDYETDIAECIFYFRGS